MFCRRMRHLNGGNGKDVVRAVADGTRRVREMTRHFVRYDSQAHQESSKVVGSLASAGGQDERPRGHGGRPYQCKAIL